MSPSETGLTLNGYAVVAGPSGGEYGSDNGFILEFFRNEVVPTVGRLFYEKHTLRRRPTSRGTLTLYGHVR